MVLHIVAIDVIAGDLSLHNSLPRQKNKIKNNVVDVWLLCENEIINQRLHGGDNVG